MKTTIQFTFIGLIACLSPVYSLLLITAAVSIIDLLTGLSASLISKGLKAFSSHTLARSIVKIGFYQLSILLAFGTGHALVSPEAALLLAKCVTGFILMVEFSSVMENMYKITRNKVFLGIYNIFATFLNKNKNIINSIDYKFGKKTKKNNNETNQTSNN